MKKCIITIWLILCLCLLAACNKSQIPNDTTSPTPSDLPEVSTPVIHGDNIHMVSAIPGLGSIESPHPFVGKGNTFIFVASPDDSGTYDQKSDIIFLLDVNTGTILHTLSGYIHYGVRKIKTTENGYIIINEREIIAVDDNLSVTAAFTNEDTEKLLGNILLGEYYSFDISDDLSTIVAETPATITVIDTKTSAIKASWNKSIADKDSFLHTNGTPTFVGGTVNLITQAAFRNKDYENTGTDIAEWGYLLTNLGNKIEQTFVSLSKDDETAFSRAGDEMPYIRGAQRFCYIENSNDLEEVKEPEAKLTLWTVDIVKKDRTSYEFLLDPFDGEKRSILPAYYLNPNSFYIQTYTNDGKVSNGSLSLVKPKDNTCRTIAFFTPAGLFDSISYSENGAVLMYYHSDNKKSFYIVMP